MPISVSSSSRLAEIGTLADYSVRASAMPTDVADSSGAVTSFEVSTAGDHDDAEYLIGETLTLQGEGLGLVSGEATSVSKGRKSGRITLSADTIMARMNAPQRVFPIYETSTHQTRKLASAIDHWTQAAGIPYDDFGVLPYMYHSFYGHEYPFRKGTNPLRRLVAAGPNGISYRYANGRLVMDIQKQTTIGPSWAVEAENLALPIKLPKAPDNEWLIFTAGLEARGTHAGSVTFTTPVGAILLKFSSVSGFSVEDAGTGVVIPTNAAAQTGFKRVYIAVRRAATGLASNVRLVVVNDVTGAIERDTTVTWTLASLSDSNAAINMFSVYANSDGTGDTWGVYGLGAFLSSGVPTTLPRKAKAFGETRQNVELVPGFSGNVWEHTKQACALHKMDFQYENGQLVLRPLADEISQDLSLSEASMQIQNRESARHVEVICQNSEAVRGTPKVVWEAESTYSLAIGEVQEFTVQTEHSISEVNSPMCVDEISPWPYTQGAGVYTVWGSDGWIIPSGTWLSMGGKVEAFLTDNDGEIRIVMTAPSQQTEWAPYTISRTMGNDPALFITGRGVINKPETMKIPTGNPEAANDVGTTIDSPFVTDRRLAYDTACAAAEQFASPQLVLNIGEPTDHDKATPWDNGSLVQKGNNVYRVTSTTKGPSRVQGSAAQHTTLKQIADSFGEDATIGEMNAYYGDKTIREINLKPLKGNNG